MSNASDIVTGTVYHKFDGEAITVAILPIGSWPLATNGKPVITFSKLLMIILRSLKSKSKKP